MQKEKKLEEGLDWSIANRMLLFATQADEKENGSIVKEEKWENRVQRELYVEYNIMNMVDRPIVNNRFVFLADQSAQLTIISSTSPSDQSHLNRCIGYNKSDVKVMQEQNAPPGSWFRATILQSWVLQHFDH